MNDSYFDFNVTGAERKRLVEAIAAYTGADAIYLGAPSFAYQVGGFNIDRNGIVSFDEQLDSKEIEDLIEALTEQGFTVHEGYFPKVEHHQRKEVPNLEQGKTYPQPHSKAEEQIQNNIQCHLVQFHR